MRIPRVSTHRHEGEGDDELADEVTESMLRGRAWQRIPERMPRPGEDGFS